MRSKELFINATGNGSCGFGPEYCGENCTSGCNHKSECDPSHWGPPYANATNCPLNSFCPNTTVTPPSCDVSSNTTRGRVVGYYEGWNWQIPCGRMPPAEIPLGYYTHIIFAFSMIDNQSFSLSPMDSITSTLFGSPLAAGGMNNPGPTRKAFSTLAQSHLDQDLFFDSLVRFMQDNDSDGVDLDWEYPVAEDRGGAPEDLQNFVRIEPAGYYYMKGFNISGLEPHVDWFNVMTYDLHGDWDANITTVTNHAPAHTNLTEINDGLDLLWRNKIDPARVNMGLGFCGRTFTMEDPDCMAVNCPFKELGHAGGCTNTTGVLSISEINNVIHRRPVNITLDEKAAVKIATWDTDQWISYDDEATLKMKVDYANRHCLGGTMVWAVDFDDGTLSKALSASLGREISPVMPPYGAGNWSYGNETRRMSFKLE
ncbi:glycoside hydrolase superfamily [Pseudomassariella vexata]|uniref:chitinase n=1 Tax=Pseudomassariella vexata TaxID=1141098 RepID=A0A1Y2EAR5_9PEZI|nr:glycoside hydrolase superfamily [Pseudomassariella vexata]ORY68394.1 glycoside hydrolase superfamily [Pseudomassariella vexata]